MEAWSRPPISRRVCRVLELRGAAGLKGGLLCPGHGLDGCFGEGGADGRGVVDGVSFFVSRPVFAASSCMAALPVAAASPWGACYSVLVEKR